MIDRLVEWVLRMRGLVLLAIVAVMVYGAYAYRRMPVDAFPDISPIMVPVFAEAHGLAPEEIERLITYPIESAMNGLPGVTQVKSTSSFGMAVVYVYFRDGVDMYFARQLVAERLADARNDLPEMDEQPALGPISTGLGQIFIYYLTLADGAGTDGKEPDVYLREINDWVVKYQLKTVPGVTDILSIGGHVLQYQIRVEPNALLKYGLSLEHIVQAVHANNRNVGGQFLVLGAEESLVRGLGLVQNIEDIANIPVAVHNGVAVKLGDVAEVAYGNEIRRGVVTRNGEGEVVSGLVLKLYGENTSGVIQRLYAKVQDLQASLPSGVTIVPYYEQADLVEQATSTVKRALLQGAVFVVAVLLLFLGNVRSALIVAVSLPLSALTAVICMGFAGISANLMSLGGIAIAIGMLGDGAIVVVENIFRHLNEPRNQRNEKSGVILTATREVSRPVVFSIAIIILVFLPVFTLQEVEGKMFGPMAFAITFALLGSMAAALVVAPVLSSYALKHGAQTEFVLLQLLKRAYRPMLEWAIRFRGAVVALALLALTASLALVPHLGAEFIPTLEEGSILIGVTMAPSISLERAAQTVMELEKRIMKHPQVRETVSRIGRPEAGSHPHPVNYAEIHVELERANNTRLRRDKETLVDALSRELNAYPGVQLNFTQPIQNAFDELLSGTKAQIAIKVYGEDLDVLRQKADQILAAVETVTGLVDMASEQSYGQPQVRIIVNRAACARYGIPANRILELVELAVGGEVIDTLYQNTRRYGIHVRFAEEARKNPQAIRDLLLHADDGALIPLSQVASVEQVVGPIQINREKNQRRWIVQGNVRGRDLGSVVASLRARIERDVELPPGYYVEYGGQFENQQRAMTRLGLIVPIVFGAVLLMLYLSLGSMRDALIIMVNVPLALIGGIAGLFASGEYLSVPASVGFIALFGIAVQNGVVLVSYFRQLTREGMTLRDSILHGATLRLRPVLMTAATTVLGLMPLLLSHGVGSEVQRPLAVVVVFGLTTSTLLTLFVMPVVYSWFGPGKSR